jgi:hypothetical protein
MAFSTFVAEGGLGLGARGAEPARESGGIVHEPHALAAAAARGLQHDGEADVLHQALDLAVGLDGMLGARDDGHLGGDHAAARLDLVAHGLDGLGRGADESEPRLAHGAREGRALGEEAVAGVHGVGTCVLRDAEQLVDDEIALGGGGRTDVKGLVGEPHVQRGAVGVGVDGDRLDAELAAGADDAHRDLAAVGHEHASDRTGLGEILFASHALVPDAGNGVP